jgi:predicted glycosyltransferase
MRVLFYAINHVGLGHVVRLSIVQRFLSERNLADCHFFSESRHAAAFFTCPGVLIDVDRAPGSARAEHVSAKERWRRLEAGVRRAVEDLRPDILMCDTYFSEAVTSIPTVVRRGGRAVLMLTASCCRIIRERSDGRTGITLICFGGSTRHAWSPSARSAAPRHGPPAQRR